MASEKKGFALKASVEDFAGGSFAYGDGKTFDIKKELVEGDGVIVTDDPQLADLLSGMDILKSASPKQEKAAPAAPPTPPAQTGSGSGEGGGVPAAGGMLIA